MKSVNSTQWSPSWKANSQSASQEILNHLWNPKIDYCIHKSLSLDPILGQKLLKKLEK